MSEASANALALTLKFGDSELAKEVELIIRGIVAEEIQQALIGFEVRYGHAAIVNNAHAIEKIAVRKMTQIFTQQPQY